MQLCHPKSLKKVALDESKIKSFVKATNSVLYPAFKRFIRKDSEIPLPLKKKRLEEFHFKTLNY